MMSPELWVAIAGQTIVILLAIVASAMRGEKRISQCETKIEHLENEVAPIPGISRAVARLEGRNKAIDAAAAAGKK